MDYVLLKEFHSLLRWVIIFAGAWALFRVWTGFTSKAVWSKQDRIAGLVFTSALNLQLVLGLILYKVSPVMVSAMHNFRSAVKIPDQRFFLLEHPTMMLIAIIIAQVGFSLSKRAPHDHAKFKKAAIFYTIAMVIILVAIPWPFLKYGRPLVPFLN